MSSASQQTKTDFLDLNAFQRDLLWAIVHEGGAEYGLGLKESLEESGYDKINHGRLYPNLDTLVRSGFVEKNELDRRTNEYALTDEGNELLSDRQSWERGEA